MIAAKRCGDANAALTVIGCCCYCYSCHNEVAVIATTTAAVAETTCVNYDGDGCGYDDGGGSYYYCLAVAHDELEEVAAVTVAIIIAFIIVVVEEARLNCGV